MDWEEPELSPIDKSVCDSKLQTKISVIRLVAADWNICEEFSSTDKSIWGSKHQSQITVMRLISTIGYKISIFCQKCQITKRE